MRADRASRAGCTCVTLRAGCSARWLAGVGRAEIPVAIVADVRRNAVCAFSTVSTSGPRFTIRALEVCHGDKILPRLSAVRAVLDVTVRHAQVHAASATACPCHLVDRRHQRVLCCSRQVGKITGSLVQNAKKFVSDFLTCRRFWFVSTTNGFFARYSCRSGGVQIPGINANVEKICATDNRDRAFVSGKNNINIAVVINEPCRFVFVCFPFCIKSEFRNKIAVVAHIKCSVCFCYFVLHRYIDNWHSNRPFQSKKDNSAAP